MATSGGMDNGWVAKHLFCGGLANALGIIIGNPLDVIKVRLQSMPDQYSSAFGCFRSILKYEGIGGFFKGVWAPTYAQFVMGSLAFAGNEITKKLLEPNLAPGEACSPVNGYIAGCMGGLAQSIVLVPTDVIKCKMQVNNAGVCPVTQQPVSDKVYSSSMDCIAKTFRSEGIKGFYKGFAITCFREVPSFGVYFLVYDQFTEVFTQSLKLSPTLSILGAGGIAGSLSWFVVYPVDVIKTNLQIQQSVNDSSVGSQPTGVISMTRHLYQKHGIRVFSRGLGTTMVRAFPVNAAVFLFYEEFKEFFGI